MAPTDNTTSNLPKITLQIFELERIIKNLKWWQIFKRMELENKLIDLRMSAWDVGMAIAFKDLEDMGILTKVEN